MKLSYSKSSFFDMFYSMLDIFRLKLKSKNGVNKFNDVNSRSGKTFL